MRRAIEGELLRSVEATIADTLASHESTSRRRTAALWQPSRCTSTTRWRLERRNDADASRSTTRRATRRASPGDAVWRTASRLTSWPRRLRWPASRRTSWWIRRTSRRTSWRRIRRTSWRTAWRRIWRTSWRTSWWRRIRRTSWCTSRRTPWWIRRTSWRTTWWIRSTSGRTWWIRPASGPTRLPATTTAARSARSAIRRHRLLSWWQTEHQCRHGWLQLLGDLARAHQR